MSRGLQASPSASNGREAGPRRRSGSSVSDSAAGSTGSPSASRNQLAPRTIAVPFTAAIRWPDQRARDPLVEQHRKTPARRLPRPRAGGGAFPGQSTHQVGRRQIGGEQAMFVGVVAFHPQPGARDRDAGQAVAAARIAAGKAVACGNKDPGPAMACAGGIDLGHAGDGARGGLGVQGRGLQRGGRGRRCRIVKLQPRRIALARQLVRRCQAQCGVFGRGAGHRHGAFGQRAQGGGPQVRGRDDRLARADQNPQPGFEAFGRLGMFERAVAHIGTGRMAMPGQRIGGIGTGGTGGIQQCGRQRRQVRFVLRHLRTARPARAGSDPLRQGR
jgi:hypothetical protein